MIHASDLTKRYGSTLALDRLSLEVPAGAVFGLLGPNGSGKTTFLKLVMGFIFADAGQIDRGRLATDQIGYLSEHAFYPNRFTIHDYLNVLGRLGGLTGKPLRRDTDRLLGQLGLEEFAGRRLGALSRGTLQRVGLAQVLLGNPDLILLDEPVLGLDPAAQKFMRDQIVAMHLSGKTIFLSSHNLDEVTRICTHVAVLKQGKLVHCGPLPEMLGARSDDGSPVQAEIVITTGSMPADLPARLAALSSGVTVGDGRVALTITPDRDLETQALKAQVLRLLLDAGVDIQGLDSRHMQTASLEEIYLRVTGPVQVPQGRSS